MEILKKIWNNIEYLKNESSFFAINDKSLYYKNIKNLEIKQAINILEDININESVYSRYFNERFKEKDDYNYFIKSYIKNNEDFDFINFVKFEELEESLTIYINDEEIESIETFDFYSKKNEILSEIKEDIKSLKECEEYIDNFNNFIDEMIEKNINSLEDLAIEIIENDINISDLFLTNRELGNDEELEELYLIYKEYKKKIEFKENLENTLSSKQDKKTTFKI